MKSFVESNLLCYLRVDLVFSEGKRPGYCHVRVRVHFVTADPNNRKTTGIDSTLRSITDVGDDNDNLQAHHQCVSELCQ